MLERLAEIERRYEELERLVADPAIIANRREYAKVARERSQLAPVVEGYRERQRLERDLAEHRELVHDADVEIREIARAELPDIEARLAALDQRLKTLLTPRDPNDERNTVLEIRAGTGGDEAALFGADLFRMYSRYAERRGWRVEVLSSSPTGIGGLKEVIALVQGDGALSRLKFEGGVHSSMPRHASRSAPARFRFSPGRCACCRVLGSRAPPGRRHRASRSTPPATSPSRRVAAR